MQISDISTWTFESEFGVGAEMCTNNLIQILDPCGRVLHVGYLYSTAAHALSRGVQGQAVRGGCSTEVVLASAIVHLRCYNRAWYNVIVGRKCQECDSAELMTANIKTTHPHDMIS